MSSALSSHLVGPLLRYARERGELIELARFGLTSEAYAHDEAVISNEQLGHLFDAVATRLDEPHLGLLLPGQLRFERYAVPELAARASATLHEAMQQWARFAGLVHPSISFQLEEADGAVHYTHRTLGHPRGLSRHLNEFALAAAVHFGRETSDSGPRVLAAHFPHARPRSLEQLQTFFRTQALFFGAAFNRLVLEPASLAQAQRTADPRLLATVEALGELALTRTAAPVSQLVSTRLEEQVRRGQVHIRKLARELHMSVRTLQRRLDEEGTSFAALLDQVKHQLACALVEDPQLSLPEIAALLGFGEVASFSRAFKRWTGITPVEARRRAVAT